jgi:AraC family transcriptional regulator of adaptative response/methylated-DNA-[protein]-cysteine methyltransferase
MPDIHLYSISKDVYKDAGKAFPVSYSLVETPYGQAFFAETGGRVIFMSLEENEASGLADFKKRWHLTKPSHKPDHCQRLADAIFDESNPDNCARLLVLGTDFQISIWEKLSHIQAGEVATYKDIAEKIGKPEAVRAVANAIGYNPIARLLPCHRVIRTDGSLGGYRWGLESKRAFLVAEGVDLNRLGIA